MQNKSKDDFMSVSGRITQGHGVASGQSDTSPYKSGSLRMQFPFFERQKIPLAGFFLGTIKVNISPSLFKLIAWDYEARNVAWTELIPPEDFLFSHCKLIKNKALINAMVYYPSPNTKVENLHNPNIIEILAPKIGSLQYGDDVELLLNPDHCSVT